PPPTPPSPPIRPPPAAPAAPAPPAPPAPRAKPAPPPAQSSPPVAAPQAPEVIYVEDDAALAELLEYGLGAHGYRFAAYRNGREALGALLALDVEGTHPVLVLDCARPALEGSSTVA